jgi:hypothetical protein
VSTKAGQLQALSCAQIEHSVATGFKFTRPKHARVAEVALSLPAGNASCLLRPVEQLMLRNLVQARDLDVAGPVGASNVGGGSKCAPPKNKTFTDTL